MLMDLYKNEQLYQFMNIRLSVWLIGVLKQDT